MKLSKSFLAAFLSLLFYVPHSQAQTATVNWTNVHQVIDGFGAANAQNGGTSVSSSDQNFLFGTGPGQLGMSILRVGVTDGVGDPGSCLTVSASCAGGYVSDMKAVIANGGRVYASPWSPPAAFKTNGSVDCTAGTGNGALATADYGAYATWLSNFVRSLQTEDGITLFALSIQNEPSNCQNYDSALWSAGAIANFVENNLGPTFSSAGYTTMIFTPETSTYGNVSGLGGTCMTDSSCSQYVGGVNWHDYAASYNPPDSINATPYPGGWPTKRYWETEVSDQNTYDGSISNGIQWAAYIDDRLAVENANAWLYWQMENLCCAGDNSGLTEGPGISTVAKRAYVLAQYSKFVRPGYFRIDATHKPQTGVSVSAYQQTSNNALVIIATNYTSSAVSQTFTLTNAPTFTTLTPYITSASQSLATVSNVTVSSNSFTYSLPAQSIVTFVGNTATSDGPTPPTGLTASVN